MLINSRNIIPLLEGFPLYDIDHIARDAFYNPVLGGSEERETNHKVLIGYMKSSNSFVTPKRVLIWYGRTVNPTLEQYKVTVGLFNTVFIIKRFSNPHVCGISWMPAKLVTNIKERTQMFTNVSCNCIEQNI